MAHFFGYLILALFATVANAQSSYTLQIGEQCNTLANANAASQGRVNAGIRTCGLSITAGQPGQIGYTYWYTYTSGGGPWASASLLGPLQPHSHWCPGGGTTTGKPTNGTTPHQYTCTGAPACDPGWMRDSSGVCQPPPPPDCTGTGQYEIMGGVCGCRIGYDQQPDGSCVSNCSSRMNETITLFSAEGAARGCMQGCEYTRAAVPGGSSCTGHLEMDGDGGPQRSCEYRATGANCTGSENPTPADPGDPPPEPTTPPGDDEPAPLPPAPCPVGSAGGTINGVEVCLPAPITDREGTVTRVEEHPDGSTTETTTTIRDRVNDDGTVSREIVRTITTRDSNGNVTGTTTDRRTEEGSKSGFCEENPNATICGDGNGYGASCGSEFSCSGDAVQCGIAYESHITACAVVADDSVLAEFETIREFDGTGEGEGLDRRTIEVDQLDVSLSGGGAGLTDVSFTVASVTVEIPFSRLNQYLAMIGYAMLAIAWLIAFRIISGAF